MVHPHMHSGIVLMCAPEATIAETITHAQPINKQDCFCSVIKSIFIVWGLYECLCGLLPTVLKILVYIISVDKPHSPSHMHICSRNSVVELTLSSWNLHVV